MGVLKTLTNEYFGEDIRKEDLIDISGVEIVSFTDNNGKFHKYGYRVIDGDFIEMTKTLKTLIEKIIEERGNECDLNDIDVSNIKSMIFVFEKSDFNGDVSGWDVSNVEYMSQMFCDAKKFNQPLNNWDVSNVKDMDWMFFGAKSFNQPLDKWNVSSARDMISMFGDAESFNQPLDNWIVKWSCEIKNMFSYTQLENNNKLPKWYLDRQ